MKATLLGGWVRSYGFSRTVLALAGALAIASGCGDTAADEETSTTGGDSTATTGGTGGNTTGMAASNTTGGGMNTDPDAGGGGPGGGATGDDVNTPGNDAMSATACGDSDACEYATHSCCVAGLANSKCVAGATCEGTAARTVCDGMEDCPGGQVCCVQVKGAAAINGCFDVCPEMAPTDTGVWQLCHTDAECPSGSSCTRGDKGTFPFWGFCM